MSSQSGRLSVAEIPQILTDSTAGPLLKQVATGDVLARLLNDIRVDRCLQYCFEPYGDWIVDATPAPFRPPGSVSLHIVLEGRIWIDIANSHLVAQEGDVLIFPRGSRHFLGSGSAGRLISPGDDLPPPPWSAIPVIAYDASGPRARILCGFLEARVLDFQPLLSSLPEVMMARTLAVGTDWLSSAVRHLMREVDEPSPGAMTIVARLSEIVFIELLRRQMLEARSAPAGWLCALGDPMLRRALEALHGSPRKDWTQQDLAAEIGVSKTVLCERFQAVLGLPPMKYLRDWRLYLASADLADTTIPTLMVAERAGYGSEAAFSRAFTRQYGMPPATWRRRNRKALSAT